MTLINDLDIRQECQGERTDCQDLRAEPDFSRGAVGYSLYGRPRHLPASPPMTLGGLARSGALTAAG
jgi:hypothetical protein